MRSRSLGRTKLLISGPVLHEGPTQERLRQLNCLDIAEFQGKAPSPSASTCSSASSSSSSSPSGSSSSASECGSAASTPSPVTRVRGNIKRTRPWNQAENQNEIQNRNQKEVLSSKQERNNNQRNHQNQRRDLHDLHDQTLFRIPEGYKPGTFPTALSQGLAPLSPIDSNAVNWRTGSFHGYHRRRCRNAEGGDESSSVSPLAAADHRVSIYDNVPDAPPREGEASKSSLDEDMFQALDCVMERINSLQQLVTSWAEKLSEDGDSDFSNRSSSPSLSDIHLEVQDPEEEVEEGVDTERPTAQPEQ